MSAEVKAYICSECEEIASVVDVEDGYAAGPLYECPDCGERFTRDGSADGASHRCPDCNHYGKKVAEYGCHECGAGEMLPLVLAVFG
jgi:DNA-directed RNA polymerase subunit RPC12/RpoP